MFTNLDEIKIERFKEFDEARIYIENFTNKSYDAIDYMINHKEFYFLLKNIVKQKPNEKIVSYIFLNLPCLKRKEDIELIEKMLKDYEDIIVDYLKSCKSKEFIKILYNNGYKKDALEIIKRAYLVDLLEEIIQTEKDENILNEAKKIYKIIKV